MIPRSSNNQSGQSFRGTQKKRTGFPFLSTEKVTTDKQHGRIVGARVEPDTFRKNEDVVALKIQFKSQMYLYNLRTNNPVMEALAEAWGEDEQQWINKDVVIFNEEDDFNGKTWLRIEPEQVSDEPTTTTTRTRRKQS